MDWKAEWLVPAAVASLISTIVTALAATYIKLSKHNREMSKGKRKDILEEYGELIKQLQEQQEKNKAEITELRSDLWNEVEKNSKCEARFARAEERIQAMEDCLRRNGIEFRPWSDPAGPKSEVFKPVPPPMPPADPNPK